MKVLLSLTLFFSLAISGLVQAQKKVLVIESYHSTYPWDASYLQGLQETLGSIAKIETFQMDTKRLPKTSYQAQADKAWKVFQDTKPDMVILGDDNAFKYMAKKIDNTNTPIVFLGINSNPRSIGLSEMKHVTGILERPLFKRNIIELQKIMGGKMNSVLVLFDSGNTSKAAVESAFHDKTTVNIDGIKVHLKMIGNFDDWRQIIKSAPTRYDAVVVGLYHTLVDASGKHIPADEVLAWTSSNSKIPLFAFWDFAVGKGKTAGGLVLFGKVQGQQAGETAKKIFAGAQPESILPAIAKKGRYYFSKSELKRYNLKLPAEIEKNAELVD